MQVPLQKVCKKMGGTYTNDSRFCTCDIMLRWCDVIDKLVSWILC